jgi:hypothetical protein
MVRLPERRYTVNGYSVFVATLQIFDRDSNIIGAVMHQEGVRRIHDIRVPMDH